MSECNITDIINKNFGTFYMPDNRFSYINILSMVLFLALISCSQDGSAEEEKIDFKKNNLSSSLSPYLRQHSDNPVHWQEWGEAAFARAQTENLPIFLSIGYSACHWCHVMEHESFENDDIAAYLNAHFVSIKVDREEHPDVDEIYMSAVQMLTGSGGWPMSVFLTPDLKPFFGGTYYPPVGRFGRPGFMDVLEQIADAWVNRRDQIDMGADQIFKSIQTMHNRQSSPDDYDRNITDQAVAALGKRMDWTDGGFGPAPKFPPTGQFDILLRVYHRTQDKKLLEMAELTLHKMADGGIFDQIGGGFHRYSTDSKWLTPHFEKMLYDNALLTHSYLNAYLVTGNEYYAKIARRMLDWVLKEMSDPAGGFYSSQDADSDGEEGLFYIWKPSEIEAVIGVEDAAEFNAIYGVTNQGNFEHGATILSVIKKAEDVRGKLSDDWLSEVWQKLYTEREKRIHPHRDDKVLTDWNGLMISALANGHRVLGDDKYLDAASKAADFAMQTMWVGDQLLHSYLGGTAGIDGLLDDYAFQLDGMVELYQAEFDAKRLQQAEMIADKMIEQFYHPESGGFFHVPEGRSDLIVRPKSGYDGAIPAGNSVAAQSLLKLYQLSGKNKYLEVVDKTVRSFAADMKKSPLGFLRFASLIEELTSPLQQVAIVGNGMRGSSDQLLAIVNNRYLPGTVLAYSLDGKDTKVELLSGRSAIDGLPAAYFCHDFACEFPVTNPEDLARLIVEAR